MNRNDEIIRAFVAIELPKEIHEGLKKVQSYLKDSMRDVRWTKYGNVHLTLKFLGDTEVKKINAISKALQDIANSFPPFVISLEGIGAFPNTHKPSVVWTGIQKGAEETIKLAKLIDSSMGRFDFQKEKRAFKPHLTIGRVREIKYPSELKATLDNPNVGNIGEFTVDKISLIKSQLDPASSIYTTLFEALFKTE